MNKPVVTISSLMTALLCAPAQSNSDSDIEVITITNQHVIYKDQKQAEGDVNLTDSSAWLTSVPGAAINKNGATSGIAQYRGLYGDRVAVKIDGLNLIGSGPNAMDAPMSYAPNNLIDSMQVYRGVAPVSAGIDTLGGAIDIKLKQAQFSNSEPLKMSGELLLGYNHQGQGRTWSPLLNIATDEQALLAYGNRQSFDDSESGAGHRLAPSGFDKVLYGVNYQVQLAEGQIGFGAHRVDTTDAGTPALPMDVTYIDATRYEFTGQLPMGSYDLDWALGYLDSKHGMDNYSQRMNNMPDMHRMNTAAAKTTTLKFHLIRDTALGRLSVGADGYWSSHDSTVTSPNNMMFNIKNFIEAKDNRFGLFAELEGSYEGGGITLGVRMKTHEQDSGEVDHHMTMMNPSIKTLKANFNESKRKDSKNLHDIALNWYHRLNDEWHVSLGLGQKQRAASYQALYLWVPMQSTGGLADGRTYIGNTELEPETAKQFNLGLNWQNAWVKFSPNVFYQKIDDYIQATPSTNMAANMVSTMMTGKPPLQFANVGAELSGVDLDMTAQLTPHWQLQAVASYVRGKRTDINDNLYRISPANLNLTLNYQVDNWQARLNWHLFAKQDKVSSINDETETDGYQLLNLSGRYSWTSTQLHFGIRNLLDKAYEDHLAGRNRVMMSDVRLGNKLPGAGRDIYAALIYSF